MLKIVQRCAISVNSLTLTVEMGFTLIEVGVSYSIKEKTQGMVVKDFTVLG